MEPKQIGEGSYVFDLGWGFMFNEGGRGFIMTVIWSGEQMFYSCFWTKWFAPRFWMMYDAVGWSFE